MWNDGRLTLKNLLNMLTFKCINRKQAEINNYCFCNLNDSHWLYYYTIQHISMISKFPTLLLEYGSGLNITFSFQCSTFSLVTNRCSNRAAQYVGKLGVIYNSDHPVDLGPSRTPGAVCNA